MSKFLCSDLVKRELTVRPAIHVPFFARNSCYMLSQQDLVRIDRLRCMWLSRAMSGELEPSVESYALNCMNHSMYDYLKSSLPSAAVDEPMDVSENATLDMCLTQAVVKALADGEITVPHMIENDVLKLFADIPACEREPATVDRQDSWLLDSKMRDALIREYEKYNSVTVERPISTADVSVNASVSSHSLGRRSAKTVPSMGNVAKSLLNHSEETVDTFWAKANTDAAAFWSKPINMTAAVWQQPPPMHPCNAAGPFGAPNTDNLLAACEPTPSSAPAPIPASAWVLPNVRPSNEAAAPSSPAPTSAPAPPPWSNPILPAASVAASFWQNPNAAAATAAHPVWQNPNAALSIGGHNSNERAWQNPNSRNDILDADSETILNDLH